MTSKGRKVRTTFRLPSSLLTNTLIFVLFAVTGGQYSMLVVGMNAYWRLTFMALIVVLTVGLLFFGRKVSGNFFSFFWLVLVTFPFLIAITMTPIWKSFITWGAINEYDG
jgi:hypothetical protein